MMRLSVLFSVLVLTAACGTGDTGDIESEQLASPSPAIDPANLPEDFVDFYFPVFDDVEKGVTLSLDPSSVIRHLNQKTGNGVINVVFQESLVDFGLPADLAEVCEPKLCPNPHDLKPRQLEPVGLVTVANQNARLKLDVFEWPQPGNTYDYPNYETGQLYGYEYRMREACIEEAEGAPRCLPQELVLRAQDKVPSAISCERIYRWEDAGCALYFEWHGRTVDILIRRKYLHASEEITQAVLDYLNDRTELET